MMANNSEMIFPNKVRKSARLVASAVQQAAAIVRIPDFASKIQISGAGITVTATGASVSAVAGDDGAVTVSYDGVNYFSPGSVAGTPVALGLDDNGVVTITDTIKYLKIVTAQILATETVTYNVVVSND